VCATFKTYQKSPLLAEYSMIWWKTSKGLHFSFCWPTTCSCYCWHDCWCIFIVYILV